LDRADIQGAFPNTPNIPKQLESLITCLSESESLMEPILLDLP
jgi:hypothetical protein